MNFHVLQSLLSLLLLWVLSKGFVYLVVNDKVKEAVICWCLFDIRKFFEEYCTRGRD